MYKKLFCVFVFVLFFFTPYSAKAEVYINEIKFNPTGERFVELYNNSSQDVNLTNWYIQRKSSPSSDFATFISSNIFKDKIIPANDFFVISRADFSGVDVLVDSMTLTDSNLLQVKRSRGAEDIADIVSWGDFANCNTICESDLAKKYEGKSMQRFGNTWSISDPTLGRVNVLKNTNNATENNNINNSNTTNNNQNISNSTNTKKQEKIIYDIKTYINIPDFAFVGLPVKMSAYTTGRDGQKTFNGKYFWNFGDGAFVEGHIKDISSLDYTYHYPGEYEINLNFYEPFDDIEKPSTSNIFKIEVVMLDLELKNIIEKNSLFIELINNTEYPLDISSWVLKGENRSFTFPLNTKIKAKSKITISPHISLFTISELNKIIVFDKYGRVVDLKNKNNTQNILPVKNNISAPVYQNVLLNTNEKTKEDVKTNEENILFPSEEIPNLQANVLNQESINKEKNNSSVIYILFFVFLILISVLVYFVRFYARKNNKENEQDKDSEDGSDFDILDE
jgi:hypothetical protein